jgi:hypothetical protein
MRIILFIFLLVLADQAIATNNGAEALRLYKAAEKAFNVDAIGEAQKLVELAIEKRPHDGIIRTNKRTTFKRSFVGRTSNRTVVQYGDPNEYSPNKLAKKIADKKQVVLAFAEKEHKKQYPPQLKIHNFKFFEEDGDETLSALENGSIEFIVENIGESTAEDVFVQIDVLGGSIPDLKQSWNLGNISIGEKVTLSRNFSVPKGINESSSQVRITVDESDGLGTTKSKYKFATRPYFSPVLKTSLLISRSDQVTLDKPATLYYEIMNTGSETARDVEVSLDFAYADTIRIVNDNDLPRINKLRVGGSRVGSFTLQAINTKKLSLDLGVSLRIQYRGKKASNIPLLLSAVKGRNSQRNIVNQYLSKISNEKEVKQGQEKKLFSISDNDTFLLIDIQGGSRPKQANNLALMQETLQEGLSINPKRIHQFTWHKMSQWRSFFNEEFPKLMTAKSDSSLHIYIAGIGHVNHLTHQASLQIHNTEKRKYQNIAITAWLKKLAQRHLGNINIYLESSFESDEVKAPHFIVKQPLLFNVPNKVNVFSATLPKQSTHAFTLKNVGLFSYALSTGLLGAADTDRNLSISSEELHQHLTSTLRQYSQSFSVIQQYPWSNQNNNAILKLANNSRGTL